MAHTFKEWMAVTRYWSFPVSTMPVIVTFSYLLSEGTISVGLRTIALLILTLAAVVVLHSAGNVMSDYFDYKTGVDNEDAFAVPNLVFKKFEPREYLRFSILLFVVGILLGLAITMLSGWNVFFIGLAGVALTTAYSFLKYHALGDLDIFIIFACLIMLGTGAVLTGEFLPETLFLAVPVGLVTVAVLHANNTLDMETDRKAGMKSFAMFLGIKASAKLYIAYMAIPFVYVCVAVAFGLLSPFTLICLAAFPAAWKNIKAASHYREKGIEAMAGLDRASASLQLVFSCLLSAGLLLSAFIK